MNAQLTRPPTDSVQLAGLISAAAGGLRESLQHSGPLDELLADGIARQLLLASACLDRARRLLADSRMGEGE